MSESNHHFFKVSRHNDAGGLLFNESVFLNLESCLQSLVPRCLCIGHAVWNNGYSNTFGKGILPLHNQIGLELIVRGELYFTCMGSCFRMGPGDVMILLHDRPVMLKAGSEEVEKYNLSIGGNSVLMTYLYSTFKQLLPIVRNRQIQPILPQLEEIYRLQSENLPAPLEAEKCSCLITAVLSRLFDSLRKKEYPEEFNQVLMYIENSAGKNLDCQSIAEHCGLSQRTLNRLFAKYMHVSPAQFCIQSRISTAKNLLANFPTLPIKIIALRSGFSSSSFFCKTFRRLTGISPNSFRKQLAGGNSAEDTDS